MSGSNPFRPKKPEDPAGHPPSSSSHSTAGSSYFSVPPVYTVPDPSFNPNGIPDLPSSNPTPSNDDSLSSDDQSLSDPFHQHSDPSDDDGPRRKPASIPTSNPTTVPREPLDEEFRRARQPGLPSTPPISATAFGSSAGLPARTRTHDQFPGQENARLLGGNAPAASSNASIRSLTPHGGTRTTNSSVTDVSQTPAHPGIATLPGGDFKPPASRPSNRDRVPPPPPKSHHGKLISPTPSTASSLAQPAPARPTNRYSYHGSPSEASLSPRLSQPQGDYFAGLGERQASERPPETLRRSQSQHKRPPTPPLARRHSQMRRSKTTHSKANTSRLSMPPIKVDVTAESPPPSPGSWSLNPSRTRDARVDTSSSDENSSQPPPPLSIQTSVSKPSTSAVDTSASTSPSNSKASVNKRASQQNPLPPPPPPRRTRGSSNHSSDDTRSASLRSEKPADEKPAFTPEPSNARDILADLTRLQKEVDDLRGHYESRKASH